MLQKFVHRIIHGITATITNSCKFQLLAGQDEHNSTLLGILSSRLFASCHSANSIKTLGQIYMTEQHTIDDVQAIIKFT